MVRPSRRDPLESDESAEESSAPPPAPTWRRSSRARPSSTAPSPIRFRDSTKTSVDVSLLLFLLLGQLLPQPLPVPVSRFPAYLNMAAKPSSVRKLFDPIFGEFFADVDTFHLQSFISPKMRYRNDEELAEFAFRSLSNPVDVNMMMVECPRRSAGGQSRHAQPADPSLLDYDAIDQSWRRDIEQEKGMPSSTYCNTVPDQGCSSSTQGGPTYDDQFQRDLQILTEKSLFAPLTAEEAYRYEDLSKAQYADFYLSVPQAGKKRGTRPQSEWLTPNDMKKALGDLGDPSDFLSSFSKDSEPPQQQLQIYNNLTLCQNIHGVMNDISLAASDTLELPTYVVEEEVNVESQTDELDLDLQPSLNLTFFEADSLFNDEQVKDDLEGARWMHEFDGMEILGEFREHVALEEPQHEQEEEPAREVSPVPSVSHFEEIQDYCTSNRSVSPSSGIGSMQSSGSSPSHADEPSTSDVENNRQFLQTRIYNKLIPVVRQSFSSVSSDGSNHELSRPMSRMPHRRILSYSFSSLPKPLATQNGGIQQRKRGRQSKDEQLAQENELPATAEEFAAMTHMEIQRFMRDPTLTPMQKALIKKIRRRGRNKVAARKCRERRTGPDDDVVPQTQRGNAVADPANLSLYDL